MIPAAAPLAPTQRLFVAMELPEAIRGVLAALPQGPPGMRRTPADRLHLTLRFIGEVPRERTAALRESLLGVDAARFTVRLRGVGFFAARSQSVLWAGVEESPNLLALKNQVDVALAQAGTPPTGGKFAPHVTFGRMKNGDRTALQAFAAQHAAAVREAFEADAFVLFSSVLDPGGAVHTVEARYGLTGV